MTRLLLIAIFVVVIVVPFVIAVTRTPWISPFAIVEEHINYLVVARNFVKYGFLNSGFLHDLSTGVSSAEHPYRYSHVPPGPDIAVALLMRVVGDRISLIRATFAFIFLAGLWFAIRALRIVNERRDWFGVSELMLVLVSARGVLTVIDHPAYAPLPLMLFGPPVLLHRYGETHRRLWLVVSLALAFLTALYAITPTLIVCVAGWVLMFALRLLQVEPRWVGGLATAAMLGTVAHVFHLMVALGPSVVLEDILITVSNRMTGQPSWQKVEEFYYSHDLVLHGRHTLTTAKVIEALNETTRFPSKKWLFALTAILLSLDLVARYRAADRPHADENTGFTACAGIVWAGAIVVIPLLVFPAYISEYGVVGRTVPLAFGATVVVNASMHTIAGFWRGRRTAAMVVAGVLLIAATSILRAQAAEWRAVRTEARLTGPFSELSELSRLHGAIVATNMYPVTIGFFTEASVLGLCNASSILLDRLDHSTCPATFVPHALRTPRPQYFVMSMAHLSGLSECHGACLATLEERLRARYPTALRTEKLRVFRISGSIQ